MSTQSRIEKLEEAQCLIRKLAEPWHSAKEGKLRASRVLKDFTASRIHDLWTASKRASVGAGELDILRAIANKGAKSEAVDIRSLVARLEKSEREVVELRIRLARLEIRSA